MLFLLQFTDVISTLSLFFVRITCTKHVVLFQEVDAAALLRLYLNYDHLESAAELVLEYVDALLGKGHQYFGIEVWSPAYCATIEN